MPFGFNCPDLNGQTQNISALGTPAFVIDLALGSAPPGSRVWFQGAIPGVAPYASSTITQAAMVAGLTGAGATFTPVALLEVEGAPITVNGSGEIASIVALPPSLLPPSLPAGCRITFSSGIYCNVQGTVAAVSAAIAGGGGAGDIVGPLSTVYVEPPSPAGRGNDATGQRGNAARPFATLTAALAAMQSGDTLSLASGTYAPPAGPIPAALTNGAIIAPSGSTSTVIDATGTGLDGLNFSGAPRNLWRLEGFRIGNDPGALAIRADGTGVPAGQFFTNGSLALTNVVVQGGDALFRYVGGLAGAFTVAVSGGLWRFDTCGFVFFKCALFIGGETMEIAADNDDPLNPAPGSQLQPMRFDGACVFPGDGGGTITCSGQGSIYAAPGSVMPAVNGSLLTQSVVGPYFSQVTLLGSVASLDFSAGGAFPNVQGVLDLTGATIAGLVSIAQTGGATNTLRVAAAGASFGAGVTIGEGCLADMRTASFAGGILAQLATAGSNGRVIPPTFATLPELVQVPPLPSSFSLPFRLASTDYAVALDYDAPGDAPGHVPTAARTQTSFDVISSSAFPSGNSVRCIVSYYGA